MALQISKPTTFGVDGDYWVIVEFQFNWLNRQAKAVVACFLNEAARTDKKQPLNAKEFTYKGDKFDFTEGTEETLRGQIYTKLKTDAFFSGSIDV
jgi:hypothetical protein